MSDLESELLIHEDEEYFSPCDGCEPGFNGCSSCRFASPEINESLCYGDEG